MKSEKQIQHEFHKLFEMMLYYQRKAKNGEKDAESKFFYVLGATKALIWIINDFAFESPFDQL